jgi:hypothetical protein
MIAFRQPRQLNDLSRGKQYQGSKMIGLGLN